MSTLQSYIPGNEKIDGNLTVSGSITSYVTTSTYTTLTVTAGGITTPEVIILPGSISITNTAIAAGQAATISFYNGNATPITWTLGQNYGGVPDFGLVSSAGGGTLLWEVAPSGITSITANIPSTNFGVGTLVVGGSPYGPSAGGLGVAGNVNFAGNLTADVSHGGGNITCGTITASQPITVGPTPTSGLYLGSGGVIQSYGSVASGTVGTGTVVVGNGSPGPAGAGLGVYGNINAGGVIHSENNITALGAGIFTGGVSANYFVTTPGSNFYYSDNNSVLVPNFGNSTTTVSTISNVAASYTAGTATFPGSGGGNYNSGRWSQYGKRIEMYINTNVSVVPGLTPGQITISVPLGPAPGLAPITNNSSIAFEGTFSQSSFYSGSAYTLPIGWIIPPNSNWIYITHNSNFGLNFVTPLMANIASGELLLVGTIVYYVN